MFGFCLLLLPICLSKDLPDTKHLRGGIFSWPNALAASRKIWCSLSVPMISFKSGDISLSDLTREFISGQLDLNLSEIIQDMLGSMFNETDDNSTDNNEVTEEITEFMHKFQFKKVKRAIKDSGYPEDDTDSDYPYYPGYEDSDEEETPKHYCDKDAYPNAYLITDMFGGDLDINCETVNNAMGQLFSYVFIIAPLLVIFILSLLFYIVFCFGRCCCFRAKERTNPGIVSIVFFAIIMTFMVITVAFSFTASGHMLKIVNYVFKKDLQHEAEHVCELIDPSLQRSMKRTVDQLLPSIDNVSNEVINAIDLSLPQLMSILNNTRDNLTDLLYFMKEIQTNAEDSQNKAETKEDQFNLCKKTHANKDKPGCELDDVKLFEEFYDSNENDNINNELDSALGNISDIMNITSFVDSGKDTIVDSISGIRDSVNNLSNISVFDQCDLSDTFESIYSLPSFIVPIIGFALFLIPIIMTIVLAIQACSFWTKSCCSRCCSLCCFPCVICSFCQLIIGLMTTFACIAVIFINILYNQGDDVFDTFIKEITSENREIDFGSLDLSSVTDNVIGSFPLETIRLRKIEFIKNFIDAKLDTPFSDIVSLNQLPFDEIADMLEHSLTNAANSTNLNELIVDPIRQVINDTSSSLPGSELSEIVNVSAMKSQLEIIQDASDTCYQECNFKELSDIYVKFINDFNGQIDQYKAKRENVDVVLDKVPDQVSVYANDLFGGLLKSFGKAFASMLRKIVPSFNEFEVKWIIGAFNIIRVRVMYNLLTAILFMSVVSHLYIVGMVAMSILLWVRHKGMSKDESQSEGENSSSSGSGNKDANDENNNSNQTQPQNAYPPAYQPNQQPYQPYQQNYPPSYPQPYPQQVVQVQRRSLFSSRKSRVSNAPDDEDYSLSSDSYSGKNKRCFSGKQQIENDHNSDSEQQSPGDSMDEIVEDRGIDFDAFNGDQENPNEDKNLINPYDLPFEPAASADGNSNSQESSGTKNDDDEESENPVNVPSEAIMNAQDNQGSAQILSETAEDNEIPAEGPPGEPYEIPAEGPEESSEVPAEGPPEELSEGPPEESSEVPAEGPSEIPAEESSEIPAEGPSEIPAEESSEIPAEGPSEIPAEEPHEIPAEGTVEETSESPAEEPASEQEMGQEQPAYDSIPTVEHEPVDEQEQSEEHEEPDFSAIQAEEQAPFEQEPAEEEDQEQQPASDHDEQAKEQSQLEQELNEN